MRLNPGWRGQAFFRNRLMLFSLGAAGIFLLLLLRLWYLQIISFERFEEKSIQNRVRILSLAAPRGPVYDRHEELLVDSRPSFNISVMRQDVVDRPLLFEKLADLLEMPAEELEQNWEKGRGLPNYRPVVLAYDVGRDRLEGVLERQQDLPGVLTEIRPVRSYPYRDMAAHMIGYLGEITREDFQKSQYAGYQVGEYVGKSGLEQQLEHLLRGEEGQRLIEVNVKGNLLRELQVMEPRPGKKVYLTLSRPLQQTLEKAFGEYAGAGVVMEVNTGRILAMTSRPGFDPSLFARGIRPEEWNALLENPRLPLQDKSISGQYPPGSTFKIPVALAALQNQVARPETEVDCSGNYYLGESLFRCWKREGHKQTDLKKAMRESCDVWFYQIGLELGIDKLSEMAFNLGLGRKTGLELGGEKRGLIPTRTWKRKRFGENWYGGETIITSIGQGAVLTTPMQLAVMTAAVANGGTVYQPQLIERVENWEGQVLQQFDSVVRRKTRFRSGVLAAVKDSLEEVVSHKKGTGRRSAIPGIRVAGKTGTAQVVRRLSVEQEEAGIEQELDYEFRDHALFVAYAPAEKPEIAVAIVVEHGEHGSTVAAPIAGAVLRDYFNIPEPEPAKEEKDV